MEAIRRLDDNRFLTVIGVGVLSLFWFQVQVYFQQQQSNENLRQWLKNNDLDRYTNKLNSAGIKSLKAFAELNVDTLLARQFPSLNPNEYSKLQGKFSKYIQKMKDNLSIYDWLEEHGLERYFSTLLTLGFQNIGDIKEHMNENTLKKITNLDNRVVQVSQLRSALETIRHNQQSKDKRWKSYFFYVCLHLFSFLWWIVKNIAKTIGYILVSAILIIYIRATIRRTNTECQRHKISILNYVLGNYLHPKNTKVSWQWTEPAVVGQTMTFIVEFYRYNYIAHPVNTNSGITIEIIHKGSMIAYSCEYGGPTQNRQDSNKMKVTFTVRQAGDYTIAVLLAGDHVKGSPFKKSFLPGPVKATKCIIVDRLSMLVVKKDTYSPLVVQMRDKYGNTCALTDKKDLSKFKVDITKIGSKTKVDPELFVDTADFPVANVLHIKLEEEGCYIGEVSYGGSKIDNHSLTILSLTMDEWMAVENNIQKHCYNVWYESSVLVSNQSESLTFCPAPSRRTTSSTSINGMDLSVSSLDGRLYRVLNKKLYCYISPKHLTIKEYLLKIFPRKLHVFRVSPRTKLTLHPSTREFEHPTFTLDDGIQPPVCVMCKERNILVATFSRLVLQNIGGSENFKKKQEFFYQKLFSKHGFRVGGTELKIDRRNLLESSYNACKSLYSSDWLRVFNIRFIGEEGLDWGGLRREWIDLLSGILFGHEHKLFTRFKEDDAQALVHPNSKRPPSLKTKYYEFAGRIVGKCLYESANGAGRRQNIKAKFSRSFLTQLLGQRVTYKHFETDDKDLYRNKIKYIEENDPVDLDLYFVEDEYSDGGKLVKTVELKPGGSQIPVIEENKLEYLDLLAQYRLVTSCQQEIESFLKGLNELVPDSLLCIFDENELELMICGTGDISVADMKAHHIVSFRAGNENKVIDWFWTIVSSFTQEELARLVQFITGSSQLPPGGFGDLSPTLLINQAPTTDTLPIAHTCFNQLCLPDYTSFEEMQRLLLIAITEGCEGFGLV